MPRPRYRITDQDFLHAEFRLSLRIRSFRIKFAKGVSSIDAQAEYDIAVRTKEKKQRLELLNTWCEKYLDGAEWTKLKSAIRKRRERSRRCDEQISVTTTAEAHRLLLQPSKRDDVTFSDILAVAAVEDGFVPVDRTEATTRSRQQFASGILRIGGCQT